MSAVRGVDLVIPVYNEEATLPLLFERLDKDLATLAIPWRAIFVDDGSRDASWRLLEQAARRDPRITAVRLARNFGQHAAVFAGFSRCEADAVVTLDADLQNPPGEIPRLIAALDEGADVVGGWREQRHDSPFRRLASRAMNRLISRATGVALRDYGCMLRAYRIDVVRMMRDSGEISSFIPALAHCFTDRVVEIPVSHAERVDGSSRYSLFGLFSLLADLLTGFSMFSLRALSAFGIGMAVLGVVLGALIVGLRLALGSEWAAQGVFTLFAALFVFVGAQFVALGILGEYLGRVYDQVRQRPRYVVRTEVGAQTDAGSGARVALTTEVAFKVDVCNHRALHEGLPELLRMLDGAGACASIFVAFGPDNSGRAIRRIFRRGFLTKMVRTRAPRMYGFRTLLLGTLLPAPRVGESGAAILRASEASGHAVGLHGFDHVAWQDGVAAMDESALRGSYAQSCELFAQTLGHAPRFSGAPGWQITPASLRVQDDLGFAFASDCRGGGPFYPELASGRARTLQIPTTLPTSDELLGVGAARAEDLDRWYHAHLAPGRLNVVGVHAEAEGLHFAAWLRRWLDRLRAQAVSFVSLADVAERERTRAETRRVVARELPGRVGPVACREPVT